MKKNNFYFSNEKTLTSFLQDFHLEDYNNLTFGEEHYYHWYPNLLNDDEVFESYKKFALSYVKKATEFINNRSQKIVDILKAKYPELSN